MLPPSAPALANLQELALDGFHFHNGNLPAAVLGAMTSLTFLRISRSNCSFRPKMLPAAVNCNLKVLALAFNRYLKFHEEDTALFQKMPRLETLKLSLNKHGPGLGCGSVMAIMSLRQSLPALELVMEDIEDCLQNEIFTLDEKSTDVWSRGPTES